jgi:2-polyprenyl-3-methyl-5-hydroxy-6-metoxy-1,4-benzoquinol methylase
LQDIKQDINQEIKAHRECPLCQSNEITEHGKFPREYNGRQFELNLHSCRRCSFVFSTNHNIDLSNFYDEDYLSVEGINDEKLRSDMLWNEARLTKIRALFNSAQPRILDYGIGDGYFLHLAAKHGFDVYGFDINAASLKEATEKYGLPSERLSGDDLKAKYGDAYFDVVHANEVIEHLERPQQFLSLAHQLLKPNGLLVVQTGNIKSFAARAMGSRWEYIRPAHISYFSKELLSRVVEQHGFEIIYNRTMDVGLKSGALIANSLLKEKGLMKSLGFSFYWATCHIPQFRRSTLIYARKARLAESSGANGKRKR